MPCNISHHEDLCGMEKINELAQLITRFAPKSGMAGTMVPRLSLIRANQPSVPVPAYTKRRFA